MANVIALFRDSLTNLVSRMGTARDKAAAGYYGIPLLSDQELLNAYRGSWLPRKIVDIPALDSCRKWRNWQAQADQITEIEAEEKRLNVKAKVLEARVKARLFGGAAIFIGTGDANPEEEFDPTKVKKGGIRYLNVMTRRQLCVGEIEQDPASAWFGKPKIYTLSNAASLVTIHPSRLVTFAGAPSPDDTMASSATLGWGESVLVAAMDAIKNADATAANIASLIFEARVDVINVPQLMASLADPDYEQRLLQRFQLAATAKGINQTLLLDKEEEYEQKTASFQTLPDLIRSFMELAAGAADIPLTRLIGVSPGGLQSSGNVEVRNYYDGIQSAQELEMQPAMHRLDEAIIRSALGGRPDDIFYTWAPLWQVSETEKAEIGAKNADTIAKLSSTGLFPPEALAKASANMLVENSILPGFDQAIEEAGGLPDYEMEAQQEAEQERLRLEAGARGRIGQQPVGDAAPRTLYIRRDVLNVEDIRKWARSQGFETVQDGLHVTVIHTCTPLDWIKIGSGDEWAGNEGKIEIAPGGPRLMERFGDAVVLQFASSRLTWRHEDIKRLGAQTDYPEYQPHITISWDAAAVDLRAIEPYQGKIELGPEIFEEVNENWRAGVVEDNYNPSQPRGPDGRWIETGAGVEPTKMTQDEIAGDMLGKAKKAYASGAKVIGLRTDDLDESDVRAPGSNLPKSRVWENGDPTNKMLDGTSVVVVSNKTEPTLDDVSRALKIMKPKYGGYYGKTVYLVGGTSAKKGKDVGEGILKDAKVIAIYGKEANIGEVTLKVSD